MTHSLTLINPETLLNRAKNGLVYSPFVENMQQFVEKGENHA